eukprot:jgi/Tetstr1/463112/TSEL_008046.t1
MADVGDGTDDELFKKVPPTDDDEGEVVRDEEEEEGQWEEEEEEEEEEDGSELVMKEIYDDDDSEELTESEIQPLHMTTKQLSDFTRMLPQGAIDDLPAGLRELLDTGSDADSDAEGIVAGVVEDNPFDDRCSDNDGNVRNYLARHYFQDEGKDGQGGRKKGPLPSADRLAKAFDIAEAWQQSQQGTYYQAGECPPFKMMLKGEEEIREVTPHSEAAGRSTATGGHRCVANASWLDGALKRAGGIIKHNTNAVKNRRAATQAFPGDNVDEGGSPEPPAKEAKQPAKPEAGVPARGRGDARAKAGGGAFGSWAGRQAAVAAVAGAAIREQQARRRGGPGRNRM